MDGARSFTAAEQGAMGTNRNIGSFIWRWGKTLSLWGWWGIGTVCPERLWSLLWRHSRVAWTPSCATYCREPVLVYIYMYTLSFHWTSKTGAKAGSLGLGVALLNHRIIEWLGLKRTSKIMEFQCPCYVQGHQPLDQAAQSHIQPGFECLQGWGIHSLLGQPVPVCHHPLCEKPPPNI